MTKRCAVYTRKSSEEGLEQDFNSLQAQREACEAFIKSQQSEGWRLINDHYDDGGISGGTMDRPALQQLLTDIAANRIDVVVVYKVDRLTRSLADFAKMVELFDSHGVSFVAVTQQFNTTSSMGRLTLNVLLSFAQFEREVTGERIRDKIAASKRKGMWMGGAVPMGYDVKDRKLVVNAAEAAIVRDIYERYLTIGNVRLLKEQLNSQGARQFSRGGLYRALNNPVYVGEIPHKGQRHPGLHEPIVEREIWDAVQAKLAEQTVRVGPRKTESSSLMGKLFDESGECLTPSHSMKEGRRYRYYTSRCLMKGQAGANRGWRLPGKEIERAVAMAAAKLLGDRKVVATTQEQSQAGGSLTELLRTTKDLAEHLCEDGRQLSTVVSRVDLRTNGLQLALNIPTDGGPLKIQGFVPVALQRRGVELRMVVTDSSVARKPDPALVKAVSRAHRWMDKMYQGKSIREIGEEEPICHRYVRRVLPLAFLAPSIVEAILQGTQPPGLTAHQLIKRTKLDPDWQKQRAMLGFA